METIEMRLRFNEEVVKLNFFYSMKQPRDMSVVSVLDTVKEEVIEVCIDERLEIETLAVIIMNFDEDLRSYFAETINAL